MPLSLIPQQFPVNLDPGKATTITSFGKEWRGQLQRAYFRDRNTGAFYVDTGVRESARRVVTHEFPKRDVPYAEDMGRRAVEFTVRGYIIVFGNETMFPNDPLKKKNYIPARDSLIVALETEGPGNLQLPLLGILNVMCTRYRITEEDRFGGYCVFDMSFVEYGQAPATGTRDSKAGVQYAAQSLGNATQAGITDGTKAINEGTSV
jgi:prophage DNA circulation protein